MIKLNENEYIISVSRRYWFILFSKFLTGLFLFILPAFIYLLWSFATPLTPLSSWPIETIAPFFIFGIAIYYLFLWLYFCIVFLDYYLDIWIVTNMRILDIEQKGLFNREIAECYISKIQDLTVEIKGIIPTFLNYGDLRIQTAAEKREFVFQEIENPNKIKNIILEQHNKLTHTP